MSPSPTPTPRSTWPRTIQQPTATQPGSSRRFSSFSPSRTACTSFSLASLDRALTARRRFDLAMGQKSWYKASQSGTYVQRNTFPQIPGTQMKHPKTLQTKRGKLLLSGCWGVVRKPSAFLPSFFRSFVVAEFGSAQTIRRIGSRGCAGLFRLGLGARSLTFTRSSTSRCSFTGTYVTMLGAFLSALPFNRRLTRESRCARKYGDDWVEYQRLVPYTCVSFRWWAWAVADAACAGSFLTSTRAF